LSSSAAVVAGIAIAAAAVASLALAPHIVGAVLLDFEGTPSNNQVGSFYGGGAGEPSKDYGITFGSSGIGAVNSDAGGACSPLPTSQAPTPLFF
jgi:hypothetical protein